MAVVAVRRPVRVHQLDQVRHLAPERQVDVLERDLPLEQDVRLLQYEELDDALIVVGNEVVAKLKAAGQDGDIPEALHLERVSHELGDLSVELLDRQVAHQPTLPPLKI